MPRNFVVVFGWSEKLPNIVFLLSDLRGYDM